MATGDVERETPNVWWVIKEKPFDTSPRRVTFGPHYVIAVALILPIGAVWKKCEPGTSFSIIAMASFVP